MNDTSKYEKGVNDCLAGIPAKNGSDEYLAGYSQQYEKETKDNANEK